MNWITNIYDIFQTVQKAQIFEDQKYFADCSPKYDLEIIRAAFEVTQNNGQDLKDFVEQNFEMPEAYQLKEFNSSDILQHIEKVWSILTVENKEDKGSLIGVPGPYVLPGGRFREFYYWDSYFTILGLKAAGETELVRSIVNNFSFLINKFGFIPNGTRRYFLSRSQPPFYSLMVDLLASIDGDQVLIDHCEFLEKEYEFWMKGLDQLGRGSEIDRVVFLEGGEKGNRYFDNENIPRPESLLEDISTFEHKNGKTEIYKEIRTACESGWDFSSRWMSNPDQLSSTYATQIMPVDLNCLLFFQEKLLAKCYQVQGKEAKSKKYERHAMDRKEMINNYFWEEEEAFYMDYSLSKKSRTSAKSLAGLFPLFFNLASEERADKVLDILENFFLKEGGLLTTLCFSGQQWDAPNAWAPLQYIGYIAAQNYGRQLLAQRIKNNWMENVERVFYNTGRLMEKYNAIDTTILAGGGEYPNQDGFGWTNGVYQFFAME